MLHPTIDMMVGRGVIGDVGKAEARRKFTVSVVLLIYMLFLIEGPLRKWFLPGLATPLYFLRDPIVLFLYVYCLRHRMIMLNGLGGVWAWFAIFAALVGGVGYVAESYSPVGWALGVRTYWLYMPLAFVIAAVFRPVDVARFLRLNILLAIPYAMLVIVQYNAPLGAWVNLGIGGDDAAVGVAATIVRPFGLFTYTGQNTDFAGAIVAMYLAFLILPRRERLTPLLMVAAGLAVASMAVLTGSRSIYFLIASIILVTILGINFARPSGRTIGLTIVIVALVGIAALLLTYAFPDMFEAMALRVEQAGASEGSIWVRAFSGLVAALESLAVAPLLGHGIGAGAPPISPLLGLTQFVYGEADLQRNVLELGLVLGVLLVLMRIGTACYLVLWSVLAARKGTRAALPLAGFVLLPMASGSITNSTLNGFLPWLVVGLVVALCTNSTRVSSASPPLPIRT